ncbi:MAG: helix-turn-helix domain-containing protein [Ardenticatenales bacterium]|nr:helix-turn-helix domain-containing protein [Ardenticatenales bacterium]
MNSLYHRIYSRDFAAGTLLVSLVALLAAGLHNVAQGFADVQIDTSPLLHWGGAVAIELGVVAIGLTIAVRARTGHRNLRLYAGILLFVSASIFANYDASLQSLTGRTITWEAVQMLDAWTLAKGALLGGAIPLMVLLVIESLRELATAGPATAQAMGTHDLDEVGGRNETVVPRTLTPLPPTGNGVHAPVLVPIAPRADSSEARAPSPEAMRQLLVQEPTITATDVARRLRIGRATVYRWRDSIGARRDSGGWVLP